MDLMFAKVGLNPASILLPKDVINNYLLSCVQSKTKGSQKMTFAEFEKALELIAEKKVWHVKSLVSRFCFTWQR